MALDEFAASSWVRPALALKGRLPAATSNICSLRLLPIAATGSVSSLRIRAGRTSESWRSRSRCGRRRRARRKSGGSRPVSGGKAEAFVTAAATLADQGDLALALEILAPGLLRHPDSSELAELRQAVLVRLMEQRQLLDPFGFLVYAELAGAQLSPV